MRAVGYIRRHHTDSVTFELPIQLTPHANLAGSPFASQHPFHEYLTTSSPVWDRGNTEGDKEKWEGAVGDDGLSTHIASTIPFYNLHRCFSLTHRLISRSIYTFFVCVWGLRGGVLFRVTLKKSTSLSYLLPPQIHPYPFAPFFDTLCVTDRKSTRLNSSHL